MATEELIEKAADEIEEVAEVTRSLTGREVGFFIAGVGVGLAIGFTVGSKVMEKKLKTKYAKIAEDEISEMREHYQQKMVAVEPKPPIEDVIKERERYTEAEQQAIDETNLLFPPEDGEEVVVEEVIEVKETSQVNVFNTETWDYAKEVKSRDPEVPYIIHIDEFTQNEPDNEQITYTYYEIDDVLADPRDTKVDDMDAVIGLGNLGRWGHGSNDENIVYIRNERLSLDFEVVRDRGSYAEETRKNIRHSYDRRRRIQRGFDDD